MKIIYSGLRAENYNPQRQPSFEYSNFYLTLKDRPGMEVIEFPYDQIVKIGRKKFNEELLGLVKKEKPDLFFAFMFTDELDFWTLEEIKRITTSLAWFADDHWRLWNYSRHYLPHFSWSITTWSKAPGIYARYGIRNIIRSQWACNPKLWKPVPVEQDIDVSFVGQRNSARQKIVDGLRQKGIDVWVHGWGWPRGRLSREEVVETLSRSKINLNFNTPLPLFSKNSLGRILFRRSVNRLVLDFRLIDNFHSWLGMRTPQIKARPFEIIGCRTFLISGYADDMKRYYEDGKEIVYYDGTIDDLAEKIKYYLSAREERERLAQAGYKRTLAEHTYEKRFDEIFRKIGIS